MLWLEHSFLPSRKSLMGFSPGGQYKILWSSFQRQRVCVLVSFGEGEEERGKEVVSNTMKAGLCGEVEKE